ncbi:response regulator transcription factor [Meiothermus sp. CFH 77666]|uniref:response regulator transcription factor n=1 Tax=Meiothermus sp. CFH 77666 TaxID=2817942 RepID=UPI001AA0665D|nr:response regulator transcription factor [Meiothermus sp. CFH 77666]MBO1438010.1 response regulator transcription factor [Meiothermus sp. CFH 77666]
MRLLLVEDNPRLAGLVQEVLSAQGWAVDTAILAEEAWGLLESFPYDLLVLDLGLPDGDGLSLLQRLRGAGRKLPVLILTARDAPEARIAGLEVGADDYVVKPFHTGELLARVRALLRRSKGEARNRLGVGRLELDLELRRAWWEGRPVQLSGREFALLEFLALHPEGYYPREVLLEKCWPGEASIEPRTVDTYVRYLRRKLADEAIETVRNLGYRFRG